MSVHRANLRAARCLYDLAVAWNVLDLLLAMAAAGAAIATAKREGRL